jgi:hypothetical protein
MRYLSQVTSWLAAILLVAVVCDAPIMAQPRAVKAFPGAQGFGTDTKHGRGGRVIAVTNLKARGEGSFRAAVAAKGPRIIVFKVGGVIDLGDDLIEMKNPHCMIAGQTAPGDGICLKGAPLRIRTHDVVVRYLRSRPGDDPRAYNPRRRFQMTWHFA